MSLYIPEMHPNSLENAKENINDIKSILTFCGSDNLFSYRRTIYMLIETTSPTIVKKKYPGMSKTV